MATSNQFSNNSSTSNSTSNSSSSTQMIPGMVGIYNQLLGMNQGNYQNVLNSYNNANANMNAQLPAIYRGYDQISSQIQNTLGLSGGGWGVATPAVQAIDRSFAQARGNTDQQMINSGLGNTTVRGNLQNQNAMQAGQAYGALGAQLAQLSAGYTSQLGQARQGAMMQGLQQQTGLANSLMGNLAGYRFQNTAGNLTGGFSNSTSNSMSNQSGSSGGSSYSPNSGGGGGGGGSGTAGQTASQHLGFGNYNAGGSGPGVGPSPYSIGYGNYLGGNINTGGSPGSPPNPAGPDDQEWGPLTGSITGGFGQGSLFGGDEPYLF